MEADDRYELYVRIADVAYEMAETYMENSNPDDGHITCTDKGLKQIQKTFDNINDEFKVAVFSQFLEELQEREIAYDPKQFYAKAN